MSDPVVTAYREFTAAHSAMLAAAERVRMAVAAEVGVVLPQGDGRILVIQQVVARAHGFSREELLTNKRTAGLVLARQVAMWLCRTLTKHSLETVGAAFQRDHGTVMWAVRSIGNRADTEPAFASALLDIRAKVEAALEKST